MSSAKTREHCEAIAAVVCDCRTMDWIQFTINPANTSVVETLGRMRKVWIDTITPQVKTIASEPLGSTILGWFEPRATLADLHELPGSQLMKDEFLSIIRIAVDSTCSDLRGLHSDYDRYQLQLDFFLHSIGVIAAKKSSWTESVTKSGGTIASTVVPFIATIFSPMIAISLAVLKASSDAKSLASNAPPKDEVVNNTAFFTFVQLLYARQVNQLAPEIINRIAQIDRTIRSLICRDEMDAWVVMLGRRQTVLLAGGGYTSMSKGIPIKSLYGGDDEGDIDTRIARLLLDYPHLPNLAHIVTLIRENSVSNQPRRVQVAISGDPGTGKTRFVNRLAAALGLPIHHLRVGTADDFGLLCVSSNQIKSSDFVWMSKESSNEYIMSSIPYTMTKAGVCNPILFIDEASGLLSGSLGGGLSMVSAHDSLKLLFDDNNNMISAPMIARDVRFDYSRITVIMATTQSMTAAQVDPALINRFWSFAFTPLSIHVKRRILNDYLESLSSSRLTHGENAQARVSAREFVNFIAEISEERGYTGGRAIQRALWAVFAECGNMVGKKWERSANWRTDMRERIDFALPPL